MDDRDKIYLEFAIKILELLERDDLNNRGALERVRIFYVKATDEIIEDVVFKFFDLHNINYSLSYSSGPKLHTVILESEDWLGMPDIEETDLLLVDALVKAALKSFDRLVTLGILREV